MYNEKKQEYNREYTKKNFKRVPLDVQKSFYDGVLKPAADAAGLAVNAYIKQAINEKISRDGE